MLCIILKQIYLNDIHKSLDSDELIYSAEVKQTFLDLWCQVNIIKTYNNLPDSKFYMKNNEYLFELEFIEDTGICFYCHEINVWDIFTNKYNLNYKEIDEIISQIVENLLNIKIRHCDSLHEHYWKFTLLNKI